MAGPGTDPGIINLAALVHDGRLSILPMDSRGPFYLLATRPRGDSEEKTAGRKVKDNTKLHGNTLGNKPTILTKLKT